jgi:hypothetical protein
MTEADLTKIESALGFALPSDYLDFLRTQSDEVRRIKEMLPLRAVLWTEADDIIRQNRDGRKYAKDMTVGENAQPWPTNYMVVGTNGGGDYWFIHRDGSKRGLWFWQHETCAIERTNASFSDYMRDLHRAEKTPEKWQMPAVRSSFDAACPLMERFAVFISRKTCEIECQEADRPLTAAKLRQHGIDIDKLGHCVLAVIAALAKCNPHSLSIKLNRKPSYGMLKLNFSESPIQDARFRWVGANIFRGNVFVTLHGPQEKAPPPQKAGIDWEAFRQAVTDLLQTIHPPGTKVTLSKPRPSMFTMQRDQWKYDLTYSLKEGRARV